MKTVKITTSYITGPPSITLKHLPESNAEIYLNIGKCSDFETIVVDFRKESLCAIWLHCLAKVLMYLAVGSVALATLVYLAYIFATELTQLILLCFGCGVAIVETYFYANHLADLQEIGVDKLSNYQFDFFWVLPLLGMVCHVLVAGYIWLMMRFDDGTVVTTNFYFCYNILFGGGIFIIFCQGLFSACLYIHPARVQ